MQVHVLLFLTGCGSATILFLGSFINHILNLMKIVYYEFFVFLCVCTYNMSYMLI